MYFTFKGFRKTKAANKRILLLRYGRIRALKPFEGIFLKEKSYSEKKWNCTVVNRDNINWTGENSTNSSILDINHKENNK